MQPAQHIQSSSLVVTHSALSLLRPDPANPRKHSDRQLKALAKSIQAFGFNIPIAVNAEMQVLAGHARLEAARRLGMTQVPVVRLDHLSPEQARAFVVADNRLSELSTWDESLLSLQLKELSVLDLDFDLEATGFSMGEIDLRIEGLEAGGGAGRRLTSNPAARRPGHPSGGPVAARWPPGALRQCSKPRGLRHSDGRAPSRHGDHRPAVQRAGGRACGR